MKSLYQNIVEKQSRLDTCLTHQYTDDIKSALYDYVAGYITSVNNELRKDRHSENTVKLLDAAFDNFGVRTNIDVYRTVTLDYLKNLYGITENNAERFIGKPFVCKGYMSASKNFASPWASEWFDEEAVIHVISKIPQNCIIINNVFNSSEIDCAEQNEVLLPRNLKFTIRSIERKSGKQFGKNGNMYIEIEIL